MDDILNWIRKNLKIVIFSLLGVIVFSVFIGLIIGIASRPEKIYNKELYQQLTELKKAAEKQEKFNNQSVDTFLIPPQVDVNIDDIFNTEYSDELSYLLDNLKLKPIKISNLINERTIGENTTVKAVIFNNEERDIITIKDEIAEP